MFPARRSDETARTSASGFAIVAGTTILSVVIHYLYAVSFSTAAMVRL